MTDTKNTLTNTQSTKPVVNRVPPKNPMFNQFKKPNFNNNMPKFSGSFHNQNRGSGGK